MISKPNHGWCEVKIGNFTTRASYVTDLPFEWLKCCLFGLTEKVPVTLYIDEEGAECYITAYYGEAHVVFDGENGKNLIHFSDMDHLSLAKWIVEDIEANFYDWVRWSPYETTEEDHRRREVELNKLLVQVKDALSREMNR